MARGLPALYINHLDESATVRSSLPRTLGVSMLLLLMFSLVLAVPAHAPPLGAPQSLPIWVTINSTATANYPGGNELFTVFVVNSAADPKINETIENMTLTASFGSNFAIGLPATLTQGQTLLETIHLEIPATFKPNNFTANLVVHATLINGTIKKPLPTITGTAEVNVFSLTPSSTNQTSTAQAGGVSTTTFEIGVAAPSIVSVLLLILLVQARSSSKRMGT
jgi:hypothetical protein